MEVSKIDLKTYGFIQNLMMMPNLKKRVRTIRLAHKIPKNGLSSDIFDKLILSEKNPRIPAKINKTVFWADIKNLLNNYNLSSLWIDFFSDYILFNYLGDYSNIRQIITLDLGTKTKNPELVKRTLEMSQKFDLNPIALLLPPSMSERELDNYIRVNFKKIKSLQQEYINRTWVISKLRQNKNKNQERDKFIYKNRNLPKRELIAKMGSKFGKILDYTYINKIIKKEGRRKSAGI